MSDTHQSYQQNGIKSLNHLKKHKRNKPLTKVAEHIYTDSKQQRYGKLANGQIVKLVS